MAFFLLFISLFEGARLFGVVAWVCDSGYTALCIHSISQCVF